MNAASSEVIEDFELLTKFTAVLDKLPVTGSFLEAAISDSFRNKRVIWDTVQERNIAPTMLHVPSAKSS
jgi:hypothetical protein